MTARREDISSSPAFKELLYLISHDLSAPLRGIVEFSKLLKEEHSVALNDEALSYLSLIVENGERMSDLLAALIDYFMIDTVPLARQQLDCNSIVTRCIDALKSEISLSRAEIEVKALPFIEANDSQIMRLFHLLLQNAITFSAPGQAPRIILSARTEQTDVIFEIADKGIYVDPSMTEEIFKPFKKLHPPSKYPGLGMGLSVAKRIVERHGGRIWADADPIKGLTISFALPA